MAIRLHSRQPLLLVFSHTVGRVWGACWGAVLTSAVLGTGLAPSLSGQRILMSGCMTARRCAKVLAGGFQAIPCRHVVRGGQSLQMTMLLVSFSFFFYTRSSTFSVFPFVLFFWMPVSVLHCFSAFSCFFLFVLFCLFASLLLNFFDLLFCSSLLLCLLCFSALLLLCFSAFLLFSFPLLLCLPCFSAFPAFLLLKPK